MIKLLDCTLRDGGYINDWNFGEETIKGICSALIDAGVDFIEMGFIEEGAKVDANRSLYPPHFSPSDMLVELPKESKALGMIDLSKGVPNEMPVCSESAFDGIRMMFKKDSINEAIELCRKLKDLGYYTLMQPVSITSYSDNELKELLKLINEVHPHVVYIVDTYGLLHPIEVKELFNVFDKALDSDITIGYHGHNNLQLGFANVIEFLSIKTERNRMVDGSLYGMGRTAGNPPTEMVASYINEAYGGKYDIGIILDAIESYVAPLRGVVAWGYNLNHFIASYMKCHPKYVEELHAVGKKPSEILKVLGGIPNEKKLVFDKTVL